MVQNPERASRFISAHGCRRVSEAVPNSGSRNRQHNTYEPSSFKSLPNDVTLCVLPLTGSRTVE